jgi:hypothetical protein
MLAHERLDPPSARSDIVGFAVTPESQDVNLFRFPTRGTAATRQSWKY